MRLDICPIEHNGVLELYITASATPGSSPQEQAEEIFSSIGDELGSKNARILQERVFATEQALEIIRPVRTRAYSLFDDGVEPTRLVVPAGACGQIAGVQVHAVGGVEAAETVQLQGEPCGRLVHYGDRRYLALSGICAPGADQKAEQARKMLGKAESVLRQAGTDFCAVTRTWMWLRDILSWYDEFNTARSQFFIEHGLIGGDKTEGKMPASTGIGVRADNDGACTMDLIAVIEPDSTIEYLQAGGNQESAFAYGSAFSRASKVNTFAGATIYVSGTASIDHSGQTTHVGEAQAQIESTIENVRAVLSEMNCSDEDIVHSIVYCKTSDVEELFRNKWADFAWPHLTTITDICRHNLLFEIEATAMVSG